MGACRERDRGADGARGLARDGARRAAVLQCIFIGNGCTANGCGLGFRGRPWSMGGRVRRDRADAAAGLATHPRGREQKHDLDDSRLWRPVLLMPAGVEEYLTPQQLEAVVAHELCHVRRYDNLTAAIHMIVEAIF